LLKNVFNFVPAPAFVVCTIDQRFEFDLPSQNGKDDNANNEFGIFDK
jgi:hypothetical protein